MNVFKANVSFLNLIPLRDVSIFHLLFILTDTLGGDQTLRALCCSHLMIRQQANDRSCSKCISVLSERRYTYIKYIDILDNA